LARLQGGGDDGDNDGEGDAEDEDDDDDGILDMVDSKTRRELQQSSKDSMAGGRYTDYTMVADARTLVLIGLLEAPDARLLGGRDPRPGRSPGWRPLAARAQTRPGHGHGSSTGHLHRARA
jgi:hypothetical protein